MFPIDDVIMKNNQSADESNDDDSTKHSHIDKIVGISGIISTKCHDRKILFFDSNVKFVSRGSNQQ